MRKYLAVLSIMLLLGVMSVSAQADVSPEGIVMRYINALNHHNYQTAYNMMTPLDQTLDAFIAGYAETELIVPYFGRTGAAAGSLYITTVLLGYQTDGTVESYYGYFRLVNGGNFAPPVDGYILSSASFQLMQDGMPLHNEAIRYLTNLEWDPNVALPSEFSPVSEMGTPAAQTVLDYYMLINDGDFATAYEQWVSVPNREFRAPYSQFVSGYDDTVTVTVYAGNTQIIPSNQLRDYLYVYIPVVLVAEHFEGDYIAYSGCYALGYLNPSKLGIVNGRFSVLSESVPTTEDIFSVLDDLTCSSLNMGI